MQLFYHPDIQQHTKTFFFEKEESLHIVKVLRKAQGDLLHVTNGKGLLFETEINIASPKKCEVSVLKCEAFESFGYHLHLAVAPTKMNERYEWFLEKATEIGVSEITPIICHNSERTVFKTERFQKIILSAMKQSLRFHLPKLNEPISFLEFLENTKKEEYSQYIAHCQEDTKILLTEKLRSFPEKILILIGPEGDFSSEEIKKALQCNFQPISLGNSRLRTETAGIVACDWVSVMAHLRQNK